MFQTAVTDESEELYYTDPCTKGGLTDWSGWVKVQIQGQGKVK